MKEISLQWPRRFFPFYAAGEVGDFILARLSKFDDTTLILGEMLYGSWY